MSRDLYVYACLEEHCHAVWDTHRPATVCTECGSPEIEVDHTDLDKSSDYSGR